MSKKNVVGVAVGKALGRANAKPSAGSERSPSVSTNGSSNQASPLSGGAPVDRLGTARTPMASRLKSRRPSVRQFNKFVECVGGGCVYHEHNCVRCGRYEPVDTGFPMPDPAPFLCVTPDPPDFPVGLLRPGGVVKGRWLANIFESPDDRHFDVGLDEDGFVRFGPSVAPADYVTLPFGDVVGCQPRPADWIDLVIEQVGAPPNMPQYQERRKFYHPFLEKFGRRRRQFNYGDFGVDANDLAFGVNIQQDNSEGDIRMQINKPAYDFLLRQKRRRDEYMTNGVFDEKLVFAHMNKLMVQWHVFNETDLKQHTAEDIHRDASTVGFVANDWTKDLLQTGRKIGRRRYPGFWVACSIFRRSL